MTSFHLQFNGCLGQLVFLGIVAVAFAAGAYVF